MRVSQCTEHNAYPDMRAQRVSVSTFTLQACDHAGGQCTSPCQLWATQPGTTHLAHLSGSSTKPKLMRSHSERVVHSPPAMTRASSLCLQCA